MSRMPATAAHSPRLSCLSRAESSSRNSSSVDRSPPLAFAASRSAVHASFESGIAWRVPSAVRIVWESIPHPFIAPLDHRGFGEERGLDSTLQDRSLQALQGLDSDWLLLAHAARSRSSLVRALAPCRRSGLGYS